MRKTSESSPFMSLSPRSIQLQGIINWLQGFARNRLDSAEADERRYIPPNVFLELGSQGLLGLQVPVSLKGLGLTTLEAMRVMEQLGAIDLSLAACVAVQNFLTGLPIRSHGSMRIRTLANSDCPPCWRWHSPSTSAA